MSMDQPAIQLIANVVLEHTDGRVLLVRYGDAEHEGDAPRWWIPAGELEPYEHPDDVARSAIDGFGLTIESLALARIESFRGRRGWHLSFDYRARGAGEPGGAIPVAWHDPADLPPLAHGRWERDMITAVLATCRPAAQPQLVLRRRHALAARRDHRDHDGGRAARPFA